MRNTKCPGCGQSPVALELRWQAVITVQPDGTVENWTPVDPERLSMSRVARCVECGFRETLRQFIPREES